MKIYYSNYILAIIVLAISVESFGPSNSRYSRRSRSFGRNRQPASYKSYSRGSKNDGNNRKYLSVGRVRDEESRGSYGYAKSSPYSSHSSKSYKNLYSSQKSDFSKPRTSAGAIGNIQNDKENGVVTKNLAFMSEKSFVKPKGSPAVFFLFNW